MVREIVLSGWEILSKPANIAQDAHALSDEILVRGVQRGNQSYLTILVERYHAPLLRFLLRMCHGNRPLAEDLVQETFLRLLRSINQYNYPRPFRPWLYTIAHNLLRDHFKRADTQRADTFPDEQLDLWMRNDPELVTAVISQETTLHLLTCFDQLPIHQKETILLRYVEDLSLQEISNVLNIPIGTVKSRLSLGLKQLKEKMGNE